MTSPEGRRSVNDANFSVIHEVDNLCFRRFKNFVPERKMLSDGSCVHKAITISTNDVISIHPRESFHH